jgi:hypothetical protein
MVGSLSEQLRLIDQSMPNDFSRRKPGEAHVDRMSKTSLSVTILGALLLVFAAVALDRYLFVRRITHIDPKMIFHQVKALAAARDEQERQAAITSAAAAPELSSYRVTLVADHIVVLHTHSLTTDAYLVFHQLGDSNAWVIGWIRRGRYWQIGTFRF